MPCYRGLAIKRPRLPSRSEEVQAHDLFDPGFAVSARFQQPDELAELVRPAQVDDERIGVGALAGRADAGLGAVGDFFGEMRR